MKTMRSMMDIINNRVGKSQWEQEDEDERLRKLGMNPSHVGMALGEQEGLEPSPEDTFTSSNIKPFKEKLNYGYVDKFTGEPILNMPRIPVFSGLDMASNAQRYFDLGTSRSNLVDGYLVEDRDGGLQWIHPRQQTRYLQKSYLKR